MGPTESTLKTNSWSTQSEIIGVTVTHRGRDLMRMSDGSHVSGTGPLYITATPKRPPRDRIMCFKIRAPD